MDTRQECVFGEECYRRNPHHFREYSHCHLLRPNDSNQDSEQYKIFATIEAEFQKDVGNKPSQNESPSTSTVPQIVNEIPKNVKKRLSSPSLEESSPVKKQAKRTDIEDGDRKKSKVQRKLEAGAPYNFFLTKIKDCPDTHNALDSLYITDLLHPSLGKLSSSLQINFMVDLEWLMMNYEVTRTKDRPLVILYGAESQELASPDLQEVWPSCRAVRVKPKYPYGTHHTKMMLLTYEDGGVRVVVHTANLVPGDWENRTQGLWVSDKCPKMTGSNTSKGGDSKTLFKSALLRYLRYYEVSAVHQFISAVEAADMSGINVAFVSSVPGSHKDGSMCLWGHRAVAKLLRTHVSSHVSSWPVVAQCSSIGSLGLTPDSWLEAELGRSLASVRPGHGGPLAQPSCRPHVSLIYPSHADVLGSYDGLLGGGCLPYSRATAIKQPWLQDHLHKWRADASSRSRAPPHIKTYTRTDSSHSALPYFMLTSANLSKAAWGSVNKDGTSCLIMSYEAGVVWLPSLITGRDTFTVTPFSQRESGSEKFPLHYDLPLSKYGDKDRPWLIDALR